VVSRNSGVRSTYLCGILLPGHLTSNMQFIQYHFATWHVASKMDNSVQPCSAIIIRRYCGHVGKCVEELRTCWAVDQASSMVVILHGCVDVTRWMHIAGFWLAIATLTAGTDSNLPREFESLCRDFGAKADGRDFHVLTVESRSASSGRLHKVAFSIIDLSSHFGGSENRRMDSTCMLFLSWWTSSLNRQWWICCYMLWCNYEWYRVKIDIDILSQVFFSPVGRG